MSKLGLPKVLFCDDDQNLHLALKSVLGKEFDIRSAYHGDEALALAKKTNFDIALVDMEIRHPREGLETIPKILESQDDVKIIFFSGNTNFDFVREAMRLGAYDYVPKDCGPDELRLVFEKALAHKKLLRRNRQSQFELKKVVTAHPLIGESAAIQKIRRQIDKARESPAPIIIHGETGTGKEVVAKQLRKTLADGSLEPFITIDSSTIQSSVAESMLFGYEKGAFTGAEKTTRGLFEEADGGVIYFDELGNMPVEIQNKLLRVIQEKEILRIGSSKPVSLSFRVICATNQDLDKMVAEGKFKDDLLQRLNVLQISIPPLRDRPEDIPLLFEHFAESLKGNREKLVFLPETLNELKKYNYPGNVRELQNLVLYLYTMADSNEISPLDLPPKFVQNKKREAPPSFAQESTSRNFYEAVEDLERSYLAREYEKYSGNISKMSQELGMDRSYLHGKLKAYGIHTSKK